MSSDESDREPPKRKIRRIDDTPASTSSTSPVIGFSSGRRLRSHDRNPIQSSDSESGSPIISRSLRRLTRLPSNSEESSSGSPPIRRSLKPRRLPSNSDSDVSDSPLIRKHTRLRTTIIFSDNESDASDRGFQGSSQWETDFSDNEIASNQQSSSKAIHDTNIDSDSSDGISDKCPICLVSFKKQEIGTPEACDHTFCLDCIMEWSKNVNTCPVDRQEYRLILVREHINGKVINQIPIEKPAAEPEIEDDTTHCEICGSTDNEDSMLLCDGCNLGFHFYCLNPPLDAVPSDDYWYCNDCDNAVSVVDHLDVSDIDFLLGDGDDYPRPPRRTRSLTERR